MKTKELSGTWDIHPVKEFDSPPAELNDWLPIQVPSHWQQEPRLQTWAGKVVYRKRFDWSVQKRELVRLVLPGTFYWSTVFLNGKRLGSHEGYFTPQVYDITEVLGGTNELIVQVDCPDEKSKVNKRMITGVFSHWDCLDPQTNPGGLWLAPEIHTSRGAFFDLVRFHTDTLEKKKARVVLRIDVTSREMGPVKLHVRYRPASFQGHTFRFDHDLTLAPGKNSFELEHLLDEPRIWWPHDMGSPDRYRLELSLVKSRNRTLDRWEGEVGVRTIEVRDWRFYVNGVPLFIKGNNYPPTDTRIATTTRARVEQDLELARRCHFNMLRVHAHVGHPTLYEAADRAGMLLWQDFPLQWTYRKEVLPVAREQIAGMVRLLYNHPSIALWCCHNEPIHIVDTKDEDIVSMARTAFSIFGWSWNRDVMDVALAEVARAEDPSRYVNWCSGHPTVRKSGGSDTHFYFGWYRSEGKRRNFETVLRLTPHNARMISEFGAQSFPNLETCVKFMDPDITRIDWDRLEQRHSLQTDLMKHWVGLDHPSLEALIEASQAYQIMLNRYYIDRIRHLKYRPAGGLLPFMFTDPNHAIQWSIVDYDRVPKASYHAMQKAFAPQYVFLLLDQDTYPTGSDVSFPIHVVNDSRRRFDSVSIHFALVDPSGAEQVSHTFTLPLPADCPAIEVATVRARCDSPGVYQARLHLQGDGFDLQNDYPFQVESPEHH